MGAATAMVFTLEHPDRVPALVQITPAYTGYARTGDVDGESWEKLATALDDGIEEFIRVAQPGNLPEQWREVAREATRQRMERSRVVRDPGAKRVLLPLEIAIDRLLLWKLRVCFHDAI